MARIPRRSYVCARPRRNDPHGRSVCGALSGDDSDEHGTRDARRAKHGSRLRPACQAPSVVKEPAHCPLGPWALSPCADDATRRGLWRWTDARWAPGFKPSNTNSSLPGRRETIATSDEERGSHGCHRRWRGAVMAVTCDDRPARGQSVAIGRQAAAIREWLHPVWASNARRDASHPSVRELWLGWTRRPKVTTHRGGHSLPDRWRQG